MAGRSRSTRSAWRRPTTAFTGHKLNRDLIESRVEEDEAQASPDVFYATASITCSSATATAATIAARRTATASATHRAPNLIDWMRDDAKAGIDVSEEGWDAEMISYPHVFELDGKTYMAYLGNQVGRHGFGLAVLDGTGLA